MTTKLAELTRYAILPALLVALLGLTFLMRGTPFQHSFPYYHTFVLYFAMIVLERVFTWRGRVPQRHMIWRDLISTAVETFIAGAIMAAIVLPVLHYFRTPSWAGASCSGFPTNWGRSGCRWRLSSF